MCGIVGQVKVGGGIEQPSVNAMMRRISHRGPDDSGVWISSDRCVALGHHRLSIIDLSPAGHQPMLDSSGTLRLIFNGEIYNFLELRSELGKAGSRFRSHSDSEVILEAYRTWGAGCVSRFNGMFALAIHDERARTLFIARDRMGKKPLYYARSGGRFLFGSEAKAVIAAKTDGEWPLDPQGLNSYFAFGYIPGERSIFAGVTKLPPGHSLTYDLVRDDFKVEPYWSIDAAARSGTRERHDVEDLLSELDRLVDDSVRLRLIADVPLGILLSGGVDSSLITAMAARHSSRPLKTFTVTFPGGGAYDESAHARTVADHFRTEHHELPLPQADLSVLRAVAHHLDEPLADPSVLPTYLISKLTRSHVTVALGGDGGDELFGGYGWYRVGLQVDRNLRRVPSPVRRVAAAAAGLLPMGVRGRNYVRGHARDLAGFLINNSTMFEPRLRRALLRPSFNGSDLLDPEHQKRVRWLGVGDPVLQMSLLDLATYLPDDILVKVDRASMAFALEMRAPLLDYRIVEFALSQVPSPLKATAEGSRYLERELARRVLPPMLDLNRKQGFVMPIHDWLRGEWGAAAIAAVERPDVKRWIDGSVARSLLAGQRKGRTNGVRLFGLLMFALWVEGLHDA